MSDTSERHRAEPHPASAHRTPEEIAEDEAGPIGNHSRPRNRLQADQGPVRKLSERELEAPGSVPGKSTGPER
jgi:hypothetical protein